MPMSRSRRVRSPIRRACAMPVAAPHRMIPTGTSTSRMGCAPSAVATAATMVVKTVFIPAAYRREYQRPSRAGIGACATDQLLNFIAGLFFGYLKFLVPRVKALYDDLLGLVMGHAQDGLHCRHHCGAGKGRKQVFYEVGPLLIAGHTRIVCRPLRQRNRGAIRVSFSTGRRPSIKPRKA
jgi:hypothetical protein